METVTEIGGRGGITGLRLILFGGGAALSNAPAKAAPATVAVRIRTTIKPTTILVFVSQTCTFCILLDVRIILFVLSVTFYECYIL